MPSYVLQTGGGAPWSFLILLAILVAGAVWMLRRAKPESGLSAGPIPPLRRKMFSGGRAGFIGEAEYSQEASAAPAREVPSADSVPLLRSGQFFVGSDPLDTREPALAPGAARSPGDARADESARLDDGTTDGRIAWIADSRLQRSKRMQTQSHSSQRYDMNRRLVEREIRDGAAAFAWWADGV